MLDEYQRVELRYGRDHLGDVLVGDLDQVTILLLVGQRELAVLGDPRVELDLGQRDPPLRVLDQHPADETLQAGRRCRAARRELDRLVLDSRVEGYDVVVVEGDAAVDEGVQGDAHRPDVRCLQQLKSGVITK